jgi:hypothetical protein
MLEERRNMTLLPIYDIFRRRARSRGREDTARRSEIDRPFGLRSKRAARLTHGQQPRCVVRAKFRPPLLREFWLTRAS